MFLQLKFPSPMIINGPSHSEKTHLVRKIISEQVYEVPIKKVVWCYKIFQPWFCSEENIKFISGLPTTANEQIDLLILDELMNNLTSDITQMFTVESHHKNFSIILIMQNRFPHVRVARDISLNAHYITLFRNSRDQPQIACFGRQVFLDRCKFLWMLIKRQELTNINFYLWIASQRQMTNCDCDNLFFLIITVLIGFLFLKKNESNQTSCALVTCFIRCESTTKKRNTEERYQRTDKNIV
ncbi:uncharacterized protein CEXT_148611 [Caerostris extrusa]|uniref:Uncharacterized protein n=1 Tax=Caerostris extrusa TaxID=172846 RepID=A0AAV4V064_CAEEX|nr:uncharacterized protein CEXT_148611 [Caerostris extrusa]